MTVHDNSQMGDSRSVLASDEFHLLRRLSITSLVAMLVTSIVLVFLYRQDQLAEHGEFIAQANEDAAALLMQLLDDRINNLVTTSYVVNIQTLRTNPNVDLFTAELNKVHEYNILKLKIFNLSGTTVYSSAKNDIGGPSSHPEWLAKALRGQVVGDIEFRDAFSAATGEMHDVYISERYIPITYAGKRIGVFEIYTDATTAFDRISKNTIRIALIVFCAFAVMYAALFFSTLRADRAISEWQKRLAGFDEKIRNMAFYDALTQLPNRRLLNDRLEQAMSASKRSGRYCALMFLDFDNFKALNDTYGHDAGDLLLVEGAHRIISCVREADTVARFGGDEFVVVLGNLDVDKAESITQAGIVAEKIRAALAEPYALKVRQNGEVEAIINYHCTSSIGVVLFINHEASTKNLLKWADMTMYQAKEAGQNLIRFYDSKA